MPRWRCKGSVTCGREYMAGEEIELTEKQAVQLIEAGKLEADAVVEVKKSEPAASDGGDMPSVESKPMKSSRK